MESVLKAIVAVAPFLAPYPAWVKTVFACWGLLTATLLIALILARPSEVDPNAKHQEPKPSDKPTSSPDAETWLIIDGFEFYSGQNPQVRVTADINGTLLTYPSKGGVEWLEVGPGMAGQVYQLPPTKDRYVIRFEAQVRYPRSDHSKETVVEYKSVKDEILDVRSDLPYKGNYVLYAFDPMSRTRSGRAEAYVKFRISHSPK